MVATTSRISGWLLLSAPILVGQKLPNIVLVYADDLGYGDLSCYNPAAAYETPRLDRMAAEGMRFTDAHSPSTICSPSRYGLYTGQVVGRTGRGSRAFEGPGGPSYIRDEDLTVAELLQQAGYRTGVFGKWHVGLTWFDGEGERRVPLIARWPKRIPAGTVSAQLASTTDILATLASLVGHALPDEVAVDSFDLLPVLLGVRAEGDPVRPHLLTQSFRGEYQLRRGSWKYLDHAGSGGNDYAKGALARYALPERAPEATGQLYDLSQDPGETRNLFFEERERREAMQALLRELTGPGGRSAPRGRRPLGLEFVRGLAPR